VSERKGRESFIEREQGDAWQTVEYAIKQGKTVMNLSEEKDNVAL